MKITDAIASADELRPNTLSDKKKAQMLIDFDGQLAEKLRVPPLDHTWPEADDPDLLMPAPYEEIYVLYLVARIDYFNNDMDVYMNDQTIANDAIAEARAWWRRNNRPPSFGNWKVM